MLKFIFLVTDFACKLFLAGSCACHWPAAPAPFALAPPPGCGWGGGWGAVAPLRACGLGAVAPRSDCGWGAVAPLTGCGSGAVAPAPLELVQTRMLITRRLIINITSEPGSLNGDDSV